MAIHSKQKRYPFYNVSVCVWNGNNNNNN